MPVTRLLLPSLEREARRELAENAETHAVEVFGRNLKNLLLQPPLHGKRVLAVDPGYKNGCKLAVLDEFGALLVHDVIYVVGSEGSLTPIDTATTPPRPGTATGLPRVVVVPSPSWPARLSPQQ